MVEVGPMPYQIMNTLLDANYPKGSLNYWLSSFTSGLPDGLIDAAIERFADVPSTMSAVLFEQFHGAVCGSAPQTPPSRIARQGGICSSLPSGRIPPTPPPTSLGRARRMPPSRLI